MAVVTCSKCGEKNRVDTGRVGKAVCGRCGTALVVAGGNVPVNVTDAGFESAVLSGGVVLVDCWAPWCGPCRMIAPVLDELAGESAGKYVVAKLNVDENPVTAQRYQISSIPTMLLFNKGQLVEKIVGLQQKNALAARLAQYAR